MKQKKTQKTVAKSPRVASNSEEDNLRMFIDEADKVNLFTNQQGWAILSRDLTLYKNQKAEEIPYLDKDSKEFYSACLDFRAIDKLLKLVEDYEVNRQQAIEQLEKISNPKENINLDLDNG